MRKSIGIALGLAVVVTAVNMYAWGAGRNRSQPVPPESFMLPLVFESNQGRTDDRVKYVARGRRHALFFTATEAVLKVQPAGGSSERSGEGRRKALSRTTHADVKSDAVLRIGFINANQDAVLEGTAPLAGRVRQLTNARGNSNRDISTYSSVAYRGLFPSVDLLVGGDQKGVRFDFVVGPGGDPGAIQFSIDGADSLRVDTSGDLILELGRGEMRLSKPIVYQDIGGQRRFVLANYFMRDMRRISFQLANYDRTAPLVIDPTLHYSTYLGGTGDFDFGRTIAVDAKGYVYVAGETTSVDFPVTRFGRTYAGATDAFVAKFRGNGTPVYITYLGGSGRDVANGIAVDARGNAVVIGTTSSVDFPTSIGRAFQSSLAGESDAFVAKLNAIGDELIYSTFFGGHGAESGESVTVDLFGNAYITGSTNSSTDFPAPGRIPGFPQRAPIQALYGGGASDAFVAKLGAYGVLFYSSFLGGGDVDIGRGIEIDVIGNTYVVGDTRSADFPVRAAAQPAKAGYRDVFVTKIRRDGGDFIYSTYVGGAQSANSFELPIQLGFGIAVDLLGNAWITGETTTDDFPQRNPIQPGFGGGLVDAYITKLSPDGRTLFSTYLGGGDDDGSNAIAVDRWGNAHVGGWTHSEFDFPLVNSMQDFGGNLSDAFVAKLNGAATSYLYASFLGGDGGEVVRGIAVDIKGNAWVTGNTSSSNFPTRFPFQAHHGGGLYDSFIAKIANTRAVGTLE